MTWDFEINSVEYRAVNWGSVVSSFAILLYVIYLRFSKPAYLDRVSLKIQVTIAMVDVIRHLNYIYGSSPDELICKTSAFLTFFSGHANTFLNAAIALNLQIIHLHERVPSHYLGPFLYTVPVLIPLIMDLIPLFLDAYGRDFLNFCSINKNSDYKEIVKIALIYATVLPGIIYCFIIPVMIMLKLCFTEPISEDCDNPELRPLLRVIRNPLSRTLGFRVSLYPLAYSICHSGIIIASIYITLKGRESILSNWAYFGISIVGIVNLLCFISDPYIQESWNPPQLIIEQDETDSRREAYHSTAREYNVEQSSAVKETQSSNTILSDHSKAIQESSRSELSGSNNIGEQSSKAETQTKPTKKVRFDLDLTRYYIAPIPIPGARSPDEHRREVWHETDLHLDIKKQFRLN